MSEQPGRYQRSFSGMVGAMVVLVLAVGAFVVFREVNRVDPQTRVQAVDYLAPADYARTQAPFEVLVPEPLQDGWTPTSVRYRPGSEPLWRIGFLTGDSDYVGLVQSTATESELVEQFVDEDAEPGDPVRIDGQEWATWTDAGGDLALVRVDDRAVVLVVGTAEQSVLVGFATSLTPA